MPVWRLVIDGPVEGAWNMALDRAVQQSVEAGEAPPTLRLYQWLRPTVTLGRFQDACGVDLRRCDELGIDVVRRFTGGRGVLHDDEVTYALAARTADGVPRGIAASYRYLCEALAYAYGVLGVDATVTRRDGAASASSACYLATTRADLSAGARKLSGSAQVWLGSTVLQHGSFTNTRDVARESEVFRLTESESRRMRDHTLTLADAVPGPVTRTQIQNAVVEGFRRALGVDFAPGDVSDAEKELARIHLPTVLVGK